MRPDNSLPNPPWWVTALRGLALLLFGVAAILWPGITLLVLVGLFAAYAMLAGTAAIVGAIERRGTGGWVLTLLLGIVSVAAGMLTIVYPGITTLALVLLMGVNALITGALDIALALRLRKVIEGEWLMALAGVLSIVFGVLVIAVPTAGAFALVWIVSFYAVFTGVVLLALAWRERRWVERHPTPAVA